MPVVVYAVMFVLLVLCVVAVPFIIVSGFFRDFVWRRWRPTPDMIEERQLLDAIQSDIAQTNAYLATLPASKQKEAGAMPGIATDPVLPAYLADHADDDDVDHRPLDI